MENKNNIFPSIGKDDILPNLFNDNTHNSNFIGQNHPIFNNNNIDMKGKPRFDPITPDLSNPLNKFNPSHLNPPNFNKPNFNG